MHIDVIKMNRHALHELIEYWEDGSGYYHVPQPDGTVIVTNKRPQRDERTINEIKATAVPLPFWFIRTDKK